MSRCDYDTIFQRVSCVTLVVIAVTFTVILTNVFVDIDGLLTKKDKVKTYEMQEPDLDKESNQMKMKPSPNQLLPEMYKEDRKYEEESEDMFRSKRSAELPTFKYPTVKTLLTDRLETLLEQLDEEEPRPTAPKEENKEDKETTEANKIRVKTPGNENLHKRLDTLLDAMADENTIMNKEPVNRNSPNEEDMLHLAMHNILLQGLIGHMDLNDVLKKIHLLVKKVKETNDVDSLKEKPEKIDMLKEMRDHILKNSHHSPSFEENKFFEELTTCEKLKKDIANTRTKTAEAKDLNEKRIKSPTKGPKLLIKTIIDITSNKDKTHKDMMNSRESIKGIIKLIYNGKAVQFTRMEDEEPPKKQVEKLNSPTPTPNDVIEKLDVIDRPDNLPKADRMIKKSYFNHMIDSYLKRFPQTFTELFDNTDDTKNPDKYDGKRLKRQIKIRYGNEPMPSTSVNPTKNDDDDELYVEIETHFDSKGMKGTKKKKLIRNIIDKIQKAIHSDLDVLKDVKKKKLKHLQVKKRFQNPLDKSKAFILNKIMIPLDSVAKRHSDPIGKIMPIDRISGKSGESWKKLHFGPNFLTQSKSVNSAELGDVDIDYNKIMAVNGIPQRLQKPLNVDNSDELNNAKTYFDMGNLKFYIKSIDGSGMSIGINQYTDEPPDQDTMKLFTGIENLVQTFNNNGEDITSVNKKATENMPNGKQHEMIKRDVNNEINNEQDAIRGALAQLQDKDYHSNEYKIVFDNNFLPYDNYQEIYEDNNERVAVTVNKIKPSVIDLDSDDLAKRIKINKKILPSLTDENIFYKKLKPAEILSLASLLDRKKRSLSVKKFKNLKSKQVKLNRYLNTMAHSRQKIFLNKRRSKRQIDKIRIITTDGSKQRHSEENIYLIDDDNVLADRALLREMDTPRREVDHAEIYENFNKKIPNDHYEVVAPDYEEPAYTTHVFDGRSRQNQLMAKYPHIFLEEITRSREETEPTFLSKFRIKPRIVIKESNFQHVPENNTFFMDTSTQKFDKVMNVIEPRPNYRLTVKVIPKNDSNINSGFKEIHTSINKSFNKDGLLYSSLVNMSEISRIEKLNDTSSDEYPQTQTFQTATTPSTIVKHIQETQNKMDLLLKHHKRRIDQQLHHLKNERLNLDTLSRKGNTNPQDHTKQPSPERFNHNLMDINKDDVTKLLASALFNMQAQKDTTTQQTTTSTITTTERTTSIRTVPTTTITTTTTPTTTTVEPVKLKMLNQIEQNENVTNQILHQINRNTDMLQNFLVKLTDRLTRDSEKDKQKERDKLKEMEEDREEKLKELEKERDMHVLSLGGRRNMDNSNPRKLWNLPPMLTDQESRYHNQNFADQQRNETQYSIPFVYAYQNAYAPMGNYGQNIPVASVVYHGHLRAKSYGKHHEAISYPLKPNDEVVEPVKNQTKYFIDHNLESAKVMPSVVIKEDE